MGDGMGGGGFVVPSETLRDALEELLEAAENEVGRKENSSVGGAEYWAAQPAGISVPGVDRRIALARSVLKARAALAAVPSVTPPDALATIREKLTGGYDGTEGQEGSTDTTWTDFGIAVGIAERLSAAPSVTPLLEALEAAGQALRDAFPDSSWQASNDRASAADEWDELVQR